MSQQFGDPDTEIPSLPQCGFGADIDFDTLIKSNQFLFRVYTPKERSPFADDTDPFFVAPRFDEQVARSPVDLPKIRFSESVIGSYTEVARHMEWTTRTSSSYISTSFSFSWAIWEAVRRYHQGVKKDIEIAIIDSTALGGRAATAVQLLQKSSLAERTDQFWKWHRFSQDSQSVLVYGMIPRTAVLASIPLLQILRKMPSYFLRNDIQTIYGNPLDQVAWDYRLRKLSYRQFCQDMSKLFLRRPTEVRLRDSTSGAVRLALSFLRPFFHRMVQDDFDIAISYLRTLAITISQWPGGYWVVDHPEVRQIVDAMVLALGEELREKYLIQRQEEITRLQLVIDRLQQNLKAHNNAGTPMYILGDVEDDSDGDFDLELDDSDEPTLVATEALPAVRRRPSLQMSIAVLHRIPVAFQTPITPPESPRNSLFIPTVTVPLGEIVSAPFSFKPLAEVGQEPEVLSSKTSPSSERLASPPPTPPSCSPILTSLDLPLSEDLRPVQDEHKLLSQYPVDEPESVNIVVVSPEETQEPAAAEHNIEEEEGHAKGQNEAPVYQDDDDGEETDHEPEMEHEASVPPSPTDSWVRIRPALSSFSSRSSIASIETLCEPIEFPLKRLSLASTDSFDFIPPFSFFRSFGLASRTVSFSEPSPRLPLSPVVDPLGIPLPPSPELSPASLSESSSRSRCSSSASSSSSQSSLPLTPAVPLEPSSSQSSRPSPSASPTTPALHLEASSSQSTLSSPSTSPATLALPLDYHLPVVPTALIIPPKRRISLLSPLPEVYDDDDDDTSSLRSIAFTDNASYVVTGFLVGAFITLFLFSTQRRALLVLT